MSEPAEKAARATREAAYLPWESEGRPEGRALDHWLLARAKSSEKGKVPAGRTDANITALPAKDVPGG